MELVRALQISNVVGIFWCLTSPLSMMFVRFTHGVICMQFVPFMAE